MLRPSFTKYVLRGKNVQDVTNDLIVLMGVEIQLKNYKQALQCVNKLPKIVLISEKGHFLFVTNISRLVFIILLTLLCIYDV